MGVQSADMLTIAPSGTGISGTVTAEEEGLQRAENIGDPVMSKVGGGEVFVRKLRTRPMPSQERSL